MPLLLLLAFPQSTDRVDPLYLELMAHWEGVAVRYLGLRPGTPEDELEAIFIDEAKRRRGDGPFLIGGFSLGARIAAQVAHLIDPDGFVGFGYPFHPRQEPQRRPGLEALRALTVPALLVQGTRDAHGNRDQVRGYGSLGGAVSMKWLEDGNHRFVPRKTSPWSRGDHVQSAAQAARDFVTSRSAAHD